MLTIPSAPECHKRPETPLDTERGLNHPKLVALLRGSEGDRLLVSTHGAYNQMYR
jgi:hypothetical protein